MRHHCKLTDKERRAIIEARGQGTPVAALARRFGVSPRTIYNTLSKASGARPARTKTVSMRVSDRDLAGFIAVLAARGIADRPAAMRRLMGAAEKILITPDPAMAARLNGWTVEIQTQGAAINRIARKLNEAKLRGDPSPYSAEDDAALRAMMAFMANLTAGFQALWDQKLATMVQEVDKALAGLGTTGR